MMVIEQKNAQSMDCITQLLRSLLQVGLIHLEQRIIFHSAIVLE